MVVAGGAVVVVVGRHGGVAAAGNPTPPRLLELEANDVLPPVDAAVASSAGLVAEPPGTVVVVVSRERANLVRGGCRRRLRRSERRRCESRSTANRPTNARRPECGVLPDCRNQQRHQRQGHGKDHPPVGAASHHPRAHTLGGVGPSPNHGHTICTCHADSHVPMRRAQAHDAPAAAVPAGRTKRGDHVP